MGGVILTTENGLGPSNTIVLESEVLHAMLVWLGLKEERDDDA